MRFHPPARSRAVLLAVVLSAVGAFAVGAGCAGKNEEPQPRSRFPERPPPVPIRERDEIKPMPTSPGGSGGRLPPPPYDDKPLVTQHPPEQRAFVEAYEAVGRPRLLLVVGRGEGEIDDEVMENALVEAMTSDGRVDIVSPAVARRELGDEQVRRLVEGGPGAVAEIAGRLKADVLVLLQARPTRNTPDGPEVRLTGDAVNVDRGGQSLGRAVFDAPPPLDKEQLGRHTRFVARKLMQGMTRSWRAMDEGKWPPEGGEPARDAMREPTQEAQPEGGPARRPASRDAIIERDAAPETAPAPPLPEVDQGIK